MLVKVKIGELNQHAGTVHVEHNGRIHSGRWNNNEEIYNLYNDSDPNLLKAALVAWDGQDEFELEDAELEARSDGWWAVPVS